jgi:sugar/nucleoside kinase (ribokinase family)
MVAGHICLDLTPAFPASADASLSPGSLVRVGDMHRSVGGTVANTGLALHQLGVDTRMMARISDDLLGDEILRLLGDVSPSLTRDMIRVTGEATSYSIVIAPPGVDRLFLHCPGCNDHFHTADVTLKPDTGTKLLHFGYPPVMKTIYEQDGCELIELYKKAHTVGMATSLDMCSVDPSSDAGKVDWRRWLSNVLPQVDLFVPSLDEMLYMLGEPPAALPTPELLEGVAGKLLAMGTSVVLLKLGEYGLFLRTSEQGCTLLPDLQWQNRAMYASCFSVNVASTNGAGDYTIAGFLAAILAGQSPEDALLSAVGVGAAHVENPTHLPSWDTVQQRIATGWQHHDKTIDDKRIKCLKDGLGIMPSDKTMQGINHDQQL